MSNSAKYFEVMQSIAIQLFLYEIQEILQLGFRKHIQIQILIVSGC